MSINQQNYWPSVTGQVREARIGGWTNGRALRSWLESVGDRFFAWLCRPSNSIVLIGGASLGSDQGALWTGGSELPWNAEPGVARRATGDGWEHQRSPQRRFPDGRCRDLELTAWLH